MHETAHELLHKAERRTATTKTVRKTEAEAVAFVVGKAVGLVTGNASADYTQLYLGNASMLAESLEVVQQTASVILAALESPVEDEAREPTADEQSEPAELAEAACCRPASTSCIGPEVGTTACTSRRQPALYGASHRGDRRVRPVRSSVKRSLPFFERIIEQAPATFSAARLRVFLRLLVHLDYSFPEDVAAHFANGDEDTERTDEKIVLAALDGTADEKLTGLALRVVLSNHIGVPHENQPDFLTPSRTGIRFEGA